MEVDRRSEPLRVPVWIVSQASSRLNRFRCRSRNVGGVNLNQHDRAGEGALEEVENPLLNAARKKVKQKNSHVVLLCQHLLQKARAAGSAAPNFSRKGQVGNFLRRIWNMLESNLSQQVAWEVMDGQASKSGLVTGLALVSIQHVEFGPLSILDWEERFCWEFFNRQSCLFLKIDSCCSLLHVDPVQRPATFCRQRPQIITMLHPGVRETLVQIPEVQRFIAEHALQDEHVRASVALQLWQPLAYLIPLQSWSFVGMGGSLRKCSSDMPQQVKAAWQVACRLHDGDIPDIDQNNGMHGAFQNPHELRSWAATVRDWASELLRNQQQAGRAGNAMQADRDERRFLLESCVQMFEHEADALEAVQTMNPWMEGFGRFGFQKRYKMVQLLRLVMLAKDLRTATKTKQVLIAALKTVFPADAVQYLANVISDEDMVPSKSVLYNMRFVVDLSLMLRMRCILRDSFPSDIMGLDISQMPGVYLLADRSPQGGKNLLNSEYHMIKAGDFPRLHDLRCKIMDVLLLLQDEGRLQGLQLQEVLEEHDTLLDSASKLVTHHSNIPVVLGSGHATLLHEFIALEHAVFMETGSSATLASWNRCVVSVTTDRDVEKGLNQVQSMSFREAFPYFTVQAPAEANIDMEFEADGGIVLLQPDAREGPANMQLIHGNAEIEGDTQLSLAGAVDIGGAMHGLRNISRGLLGAMPSYDEHFEPRLSALVKFLHAPFYRERFLHACLQGHLEPMQDLLRTFPHTLVKWRWLSLAAVIPALLDIEHVVTAGWSPERMGVRVNGPGPQGRDENEYHNMSWDLVRNAITSSEFWAWLHMLGILTNILNYLERWMFGCYCPSEEPTLQNLLRVARASPQRHQEDEPMGQRTTSNFTCPFRQRRGSELASGDFLRMVETLLLASSQELVATVLVHCEGDQRARVASDFACARQHLSFHIKLQFAPWTLLPRVLVGLWHPDPAKARVCAVDAVTQWAELLPHQRRETHATARMFLDPEGSLRPLLCRFIAGEELQTLDLLCIHVVRLGMIPVCEITVEGMRAKSKAALQGCHASSMPTVSLGNRWVEFLEALALPDRLEWFSNTSLQVYHPLRAAPIFGITGHPNLQDAGVIDAQAEGGNLVRLLGSTFKWSKRVKGIIYRSDHLLAFQDMPSESKGKPSKPASSNPVLAEDKEGLLNLEAFRCFVQDAEVGSFYSVPWQVPKHGNSVSELHIVPVHEKLHLQQPSDQQNQRLPDWLKLECGIPTECSEFDFEGPEAFGFLPDLAKAKARQCVEADHFFFQLVSKRPSRLKLDINAFTAEDVAVNQHACFALSGKGGSVVSCIADAETVTVEAVPGSGLLSCGDNQVPDKMLEWVLPSSQASHLRQALCWEHEDVVECKANRDLSLPLSVQHLLEHAMLAGAIPGSTQVLVVADCTSEECEILKTYDPDYFSFLRNMWLRLEIAKLCILIGNW